MSAFTQIRTGTTERFVPRTPLKSDTPTILGDIYQDIHNIVIWQTRLSHNLLLAVDRIMQSNREIKITTTVTPENVATGLRQELGSFDQVEALIDDIDELVEMFCYLFDLKQVGLRLATLDRVQCPRFHVDSTVCRMVKTYSGHGTQWLPDHAVNRLKLGAGNDGLPDERSGLYEHHHDIEKITCGDVALLKGRRWKGNENAGLVHRSPPLRTGEKRLLLSLDFLS